MAKASLDDDDQPLDPVAARVQARLSRLILISGATLAVGVIAVFAAILYRIVTYEASEVPSVRTAPAEAAAARLSLADLGLPADATLVSTAADGGRVVLTYAHAGGHTLVFVSAASLTVLRKLELPAE